MSPRRFAASLALFAAAGLLAAPTARGNDPTLADCIGANESAIRLRNDHRLREARAQLLVCAALTCPAEVRAECERRVGAVNAAIPTIVFEVKDAAGNDMSAVTVTMDGKPLAARLEGTAISLDPGEHRFHFEVSGKPPVDKTFVLLEGEKDRRERIVFAPTATRPSTATVASATTSAPAAAGRGGEHAPSSGGSPLKTWGFAALGAGAAGLATGAIFGGLAIASKQSANCDANGYCSAGPLSDARTQGTVSTIAFVAGGVFLASGLAMVLLAPPSGARLEAAPAVSESGGGVVVGGKF